MKVKTQKPSPAQVRRVLAKALTTYTKGEQNFTAIKKDVKRQLGIQKISLRAVFVKLAGGERQFEKRKVEARAHRTKVA